MKLKKSISKENIVTGLKAKTKMEVIKTLAQLLRTNGYLTDSSQFFIDVKKREAHMTTGIGKGLAIPHGKSEAVIESTIAIAKTSQPIEWNSLDNQPVDTIFLLAIANKDKNDEHLRVLATLSELLMDDAFVAEIKKAQNVSEVFDVLSNH